jgi:hypothetical protein
VFLLDLILVADAQSVLSFSWPNSSYIISFRAPSSFAAAAHSSYREMAAIDSRLVPYLDSQRKLFPFDFPSCSLFYSFFFVLFCSLGVDPFFSYFSFLSSPGKNL